MDDIRSEDKELDPFVEPEGYYAAEKPPSFMQYRTQSGRELQLRLVGHNPLWGHHLWQAARVISEYLERNASTLIQDRNVLELGAGAGLPSLICALHGARHVVATDYPDEDLVANLRYNLETNLPATDISSGKAVAEGYTWGADTEKLTSFLASPCSSVETGRKTAEGVLNDADCGEHFDLVILADVLFNHSEHAKLLDTVRRTLRRSSEARALVFFTPYRPWLLEKDLKFFELAGGQNWQDQQQYIVPSGECGDFVVIKTLEHVMDRVMFEEDPGDELLRRTVFGYSMKWRLDGMSKGKMSSAA